MHISQACFYYVSGLGLTANENPKESLRKFEYCMRPIIKGLNAEMLAHLTVCL